MLKLEVGGSGTKEIEWRHWRCGCQHYARHSWQIIVVVVVVTSSPAASARADNARVRCA